MGTVGYAYYYRIKSNAIKKTAALASIKGNGQTSTQGLSGNALGASNPKLGPYGYPIGVPIPKPGFPYALGTPQRIPVGVNGSQSALMTPSGSAYNVNGGSVANLANAVPMYVGEPTMAIPTSHYDNTRSATLWVPSVNFTVTDDFKNRTNTVPTNVRTVTMSQSTNSSNPSSSKFSNTKSSSNSSQYATNPSSVFQTNGNISSQYAAQNTETKQR
jgi:hypothetical protein